MSTVTFFETVPVIPPIEKIYSRLGYSHHRTLLSPMQEKEVESNIEKALSLIELKGVAKRIKIEKNSGEEIYLAGSTVFSSLKLAEFLAGSSELLIMGATSGKAIMDAIVDQTEKGDMTLGVVLDASASEVTDCALSWIMDYFNQVLKRESKELTKKRFSAGYGDLTLNNQNKIFYLLEMEKLGVTITSEHILIPEKSVTAIAGIQDIS